MKHHEQNLKQNASNSVEDKTVNTEQMRCSGHCCKVFYLPYSPTQLAKKAEIKQEELDKILRRGGMIDRYDLNAEFVQIANMVEHLAFRWIDLPDDLRALVSVSFPENPATEANYYTCKNLDRETNNCRIYEFRPQMCSKYPYSAKCKYNGCTMRGDIGVCNRPGEADTSPKNCNNTEVEDKKVRTDGPH